ncbi:MAG TPA: hypothetical protein VKP65_00385 [Rhodothermales bacterium]|nr:hypothetical protein [Rhodothermales bacterium]
MLKFVIVQDAAGRYRWNCYEQSGSSVARSGASFYNKVDCVTALQRTIHMLPTDAQVEIEEALQIEDTHRREHMATC